MRIAIVCPGFQTNRGGVNQVTLQIIKTLQEISEIEIFSFAHSKNGKNSLQIFKPSSYHTVRITQTFHGKIPVWNIGAFGSEFEFLRYRKRRKLVKYFSKFDLIIIV